MKLFLSMAAFCLVCIHSISYPSDIPKVSDTLAYRYEVLVYSCQLRIIRIENGQSVVEGIIPAVTAKNDSTVLFNTEVSLSSIRINPSWKPTPTMRKDPDDRIMKPVKGGQTGNPLGVVAIYPKTSNKKLKFIRIHEALEMPQRQLLMDENANLRGFRESRGCVGIHTLDLKNMAARLTGLDDSVIDQMIVSKKTILLPIKYPASLTFLKE